MYEEGTMLEIRPRTIMLMQKSAQIVFNMLHRLSQETATTLRDPNDGDKGWTALEVLCHLRDYEEIFYERAQRMLAEDNPALVHYDHEALVVERSYNRQNLAEVLEDYLARRRRAVALYESLDGGGWERPGIHPERGQFTVLDQAFQLGWHDNVHIEQLTRILAQ